MHMPKNTSSYSLRNEKEKECNHLYPISDYSDSPYTELLGIHASDYSFNQKLMHLRRVFDRYSRQISYEENLSFSNFFSRIDYIAKKYSLSPLLCKGLNALRIRTNPSHRDENSSQAEVVWAIKVLTDYIYEVSQEPVPQELYEITQVDITLFLNRNRIKGDRIPKIRAHFSHLGKKEGEFFVWTDEEPDSPVRMRLPEDFDGKLFFTDQLLRFQYGVTLNLLDVAYIEEKALYEPSIVVFEPDFLVDISAVSECFRDYGFHPHNYVLSRLEPTGNNKYLVLGNIANAFLDAYVNESEAGNVDYSALMKQIFRQNPFDLATCADLDEPMAQRQFFEDCRTQFENIRKLVTDYFPKPEYDIDRSKAVLEPGFLCEMLGLQGRLDLMQEDFSRFVELKSGKAKEFPPPVTHKENHYVQMMLYFAILHYNMGVDVHHTQAFLMYSKYPMLYPERPYWSLVKAAIEVRNRIVLADYELQKQNSAPYSLEFLKSITAGNLNEKGLSGKFWETWLRPSIDRFAEQLNRLSSLEALYLSRIYSFVVKEQFVSKTGCGNDYDANRGIFTLWNATLEEKMESGEILYDLTLTDSDITSGGHLLQLSVPEYKSDYLTNFRKGDIVLLYERNSPQDNVCNRQIFKATLISISTDVLVLQLRCAQRNTSVLPIQSKYAIEHDYMDVGFSSMFKSVPAFLSANPKRRALILGQRPPEFDAAFLPEIEACDDDFTRAALKAKAARDYFLLLGPPGTGKTSCALRLMVEQFHAIPDHNILLLAYTNKAVDEICRSLESISPTIDYIRLGNHWSCEEAFQPRLLENRLSDCNNRAEVRQQLLQCRVFVSTLPSMIAKSALFRLKQFQVAIVDEASQIIEPQLLGLLCAKGPDGEDAIGKFVLIGDHKQLPAVVVQSEGESAVVEPELQAIGLQNLREALFERLYRTAISRKLNYCYDMLSRQGRMHHELAAFPNEAFYHGRLQVVPTPHQESELNYTLPADARELEQIVASRRVHFFATPVSDNTLSFKTNPYEARLAAEISAIVYHLCQSGDSPFSSDHSLGIITPYRSQIAAIRRELHATGIAALDEVLVDTVERFQGGQRDVIIYSFCVNREHQLRFLPNTTLDEGVLIDRKLNVALTRARKQTFLIGNPEILNRNDIYRRLISVFR